VRAVFEILFFTPKQEEEDGLFDIVAAIDTRCERLREQVENVASLGELVDVANVGIGERGLGDAAGRF
jgi:hypothetical protein